MFLVFLKDYIYLFLEGRGGGRERERNNDWLPTKNWTRHFILQDDAQPTEPHWSGLINGFKLHSLIINDVESLFKCLLVILISSLWSACSSHCQFSIELSLNNLSIDTSRLIRIPIPIKEKGICSYGKLTVLWEVLCSYL